MNPCLSLFSLSTFHCILSFFAPSINSPFRMLFSHRLYPYPYIYLFSCLHARLYQPSTRLHPFHHTTLHLHSHSRSRIHLICTTSSDLDSQLAPSFRFSRHTHAHCSLFTSPAVRGSNTLYALHSTYRLPYIAPTYSK